MEKQELSNKVITELSTEGLRVTSYELGPDGFPIMSSHARSVFEQGLRFKKVFDAGCQTYQELFPVPETPRVEGPSTNFVTLGDSEMSPKMTLIDSKELSESVTKFQITVNEQVTETARKTSRRLGRRRVHATAADRQRAYRQRQKAVA